MIDKIKEALNFHRENKLDKAEKIYLEIIDNEKEIKKSDIFNLLGTLYLQKKDYKKAKDFLEKSFKLNKHNPATINNLGLLEKNNQNLTKAIEYFDININQNNFLDSHINKLNLLYEQKEYQKCLNNSILFLKKFPKDIKIRNILGLCYFETENESKSIEIFSDLVEEKNIYLDSFYNFSIILFKTCNFKKSLAVINQYFFLNKNPAANIYFHRYNILKKLGKFKEAENDIFKAHDLDEENFEIKKSLYEHLYDRKKFKEAIKFCEKVINQEKNKNNIKFFKLKKSEAQIFSCDWIDLPNTLEDFDDYLIKKTPFNPLHLTYISNDPKFLNQYSSVYWNNKTQLKLNINLKKKLNIAKNKKIKVGFLSGDFKSHAVAYLIKDLFNFFNYSQFDVFAYSTHNKEDKMKNYFRNKIKNFFEISEMHPQKVLDLFSSHQLDVLFDLSGYTSFNQHWIFKFNISKIKINYLGYPGTMGSSCYDYILADQNIIPEEYRDFYSEKVIYMKETYQPFSTYFFDFETIKRQHYNLPEDKILLTSFSRFEKIQPYIFNIWMKVISQNANCMLVLNCENNLIISNIKKYCKKNNFDFERIIFIEKIEHKENLKRMSLFDLYLDTFPYNSHTTMSDALFQACIPAVTMSGKTFASRVGLSLLKYSGLEELITNNTNEYFSKINHLILNQNIISKYKYHLKLKKINLKSRMKEFTSDLESVISRILKN